MALETRQRDAEGILILDLKGRLVLGPDATDLRSTLAAARARGETRVILNLKEVDYIDSTGLGTLVNGHSMLKEAGGALKLLQVPKRSAELMVVTKLSTVFEMFEDEQTAINSFFPGREVRRFDILEFVKSLEEEPRQGGEPEPSEA